jgi:hypothetical protein
MNINDVITSYLQAKQAEADAKKRAAAMKELILQRAGDADNFTTDVYTVIVKTTTSSRLDTAALYKDFPDIKDTYGKTTTSKTVDAVITADAEKKSA